MAATTFFPAGQAATLLPTDNANSILVNKPLVWSGDFISDFMLDSIYTMRQYLSRDDFGTWNLLYLAATGPGVDLIPDSHERSV